MANGLDEETQPLDFRILERVGEADNHDLADEDDDGDTEEVKATDAEWLGPSILLETLYILRWSLAGMPVNNKWDLALWNILCLAKLRKKRVKPEHLAIALKLAWLEYEDPAQTDPTLIFKSFAGMGSRVLAIGKQSWLSLFKDARSIVDQLRGTRELHPDSLRNPSACRKREIKSGTHNGSERQKGELPSSVAQRAVRWSGSRPKERKGFSDSLWHPHRLFKPWLNPPAHITASFSNISAVKPGIHPVRKPIVWYRLDFPGTQIEFVKSLPIAAAVEMTPLAMAA